jgi:hypothetical protein
LPYATIHHFRILKDVVTASLLLHDVTELKIMVLGFPAGSVNIDELVKILTLQGHTGIQHHLTRLLLFFLRQQVD